MQLLFDIALWGQDPATAQGTRADWESYVVDYRADHSQLETFGEVVRATAAHILWRTGTEGAHTTVPLIIAGLTFAVAIVILSVVDPLESTLLCDVHIAVGTTMFMLVLAHKPWEITHSKMLSISMIVVGTSSLHGAFVLTAGPLAQELLFAGLILIGVGMTTGGISALYTLTPLGRRPVHITMLTFGLGLIICSNLLELANIGRVASGFALVFLLVAEIAVLHQLPRLREIAEATTVGEARGTVPQPV